MTDKLATQKVQQLRETHTDRELEKKLGMCRNTMYKRLAEGKWKLTEKALIKTL